MNTPAIRAAQKLPAPAELAQPANIGRVADALREMVSPIVEHGWTMREAQSDPEKLMAARAVAAIHLPAMLAEYPPVLRAAADEGPDTVTVTRLVTATLDTRTGFRPADPKAYVASIVSSIVAHGFGAKVVQRACGAIREANPADFHYAMPSEFHFLDACGNAKAELEGSARYIERALESRDEAASVVARGELIESAEAERAARTAAHLAELSRRRREEDATRAAEERARREAEIAARRRHDQAVRALVDGLPERVTREELEQWKADALAKFFDTGAADDWAIWKAADGIEEFARRERERTWLAERLRRARGTIDPRARSRI